VATVFFAFQIFCDFSGYTDIARGAARVMGIELMENFDRPYSSKSVSEFWRRWHMSLMSWFRDYIYIPLGGNRVSVPRWCWNTMVVFLISGLWHGARWNFIIWGALNGLYIVFGTLTRERRETLARTVGLTARPALRRILQTATTFALVCFAWIFFRAQSLTDAVYVATHLFSGTAAFVRQAVTHLGAVIHDHGLLDQICLGFHKKDVLLMIVLIGGLEAVQQIQKQKPVSRLLVGRPGWMRWLAYYGLVIGILTMGLFSHENQFIYFQF
jgi:D-alanyl-lipoteichoic acid acyltransferase DltB (MBOAT superfamily)